MLIYEVNIKVTPDVAQDYLELIKDHMSRLLSFEGFEKSVLYTRNPADEGESDLSSVLWTVHYSVRDRQCLDHYLTTHAPALRREGPDRFGEKVRVHRRILELN